MRLNRMFECLRDEARGATPRKRTCVTAVVGECFMGLIFPLKISD